MGGAGGATAKVNSAACTPPALTLDVYDANARVTECLLTENNGGIANPSGVDVDDMPLDAPLAAGQTHAINLSPPSSWTPAIVEVWGASEACAPRELLWFGAMEGRRLCAEFTPTREHSHLMFVYRKTDAYNASYSWGQGGVSVCPMGTCGATRDGMGLAPDIKLAPPPGPYERGFGETWWAGKQFDFGTYGRILFTYTNLREFPKPILAAVFRAPAPDPFGDAWYCAGASEWAFAERTEADYLTLNELTRLPSCDATGSGTATLSWDGPSEKGTLTSSVSELNGSDLSVEGSCTFERCLVRMYPAQQDRSMHLFLHARGDFGNPASGPPNTAQMEIREAIWLSLPKSGASIACACTTQGTVRFDPKGTTTITVQNLDNLAPCSGTPATQSSTKLILE